MILPGSILVLQNTNMIATVDHRLPHIVASLMNIMYVAMGADNGLSRLACSELLSLQSRCLVNELIMLI